MKDPLDGGKKGEDGKQPDYDLQYDNEIDREKQRYAERDDAFRTLKPPYGA